MLKKLFCVAIVLSSLIIPTAAKDFDKQRIISAVVDHNSFYMLSKDEQQAWKEFCKQGNLPSKIQKEEGIATNEIALIEYATVEQRVLYAFMLIGYCMGKDKTFVVEEW